MSAAALEDNPWGGEIGYSKDVVLRALQVAARPRARILRALARLEWPDATDLLIALEVPTTRGHRRNAYDAALKRLVRDGAVVCRRRVWAISAGRPLASNCYHLAGHP